jgi:hypothetical protein
MLPFLMNDAAIASGQAFLVGELEKQKKAINEPLSSFTWSRDIPFDMGGGAVEFVSNMYAEFATSGTNEDGIVNSATNVIPIIQANLSKDLAKVFPWMNNLRITFLDTYKMQTAGKSIEPVLQSGLQLAWNKTLDKSCYTGFSAFGTTGLVNSPLVNAANVAQNAGATSRLWKDKTADEILADINTLLSAQWAAVEYSDGDIANQINLAPDKYGYLVGRKVSEAGNVSLLTYILDNNIATKRGANLAIVPCRQCVGAGASNTDRMVAYVNRKDRIAFDITVPLTKGMTSANVTDVAYLTNYFAFFSELQILYPQAIRYADGY